MAREIILDVESTGALIRDGHRMTEVAVIELIDGVPTGKSFHSYINPERSVPKEVTDDKGKSVPHPAYFSDEFLADKPLFAAIAKELRDFIGDDKIIITCRTFSGYTLDTEIMNMEMKKAGLPPFKDEQWVNVRRWSEAMFGDDKASLNKVLDHYGVDRSERDAKGHGALLDTQLLSIVYPSLLRDYAKFVEKKSVSDPKSRQTPPRP
jgi:DNA polymerase-3 subunit epsilon